MGLHLAVEQEMDEAIHFKIILVHTDLDILDRDGYIVNGKPIVVLSIEEKQDLATWI